MPCQLFNSHIVLGTATFILSYTPAYARPGGLQKRCLQPQEAQAGVASPMLRSWLQRCNRATAWNLQVAARAPHPGAE